MLYWWAGSSAQLRGVWAALVLCGAAACMPRDRINASCVWVDGARIPDSASPARRNHIEEDVRVAQDLGIRYGDSVAGRIWNNANSTARASCTEASLQRIMREHAASRAELDAAIGARVMWPDIVLVYVPVLLVFAVASRITVRGVASGFDAEDERIVILMLAILTPIAAFVGLSLGQVWSVVVEEARMRSNHVSYRAAYLPLYVYRPVVLVAAAAVFLTVAARYRRYLSSAMESSAGHPKALELQRLRARRRASEQAKQ